MSTFHHHGGTPLAEGAPLDLLPPGFTFDARARSWPLVLDLRPLAVREPRAYQVQSLQA